MLSNETTTITKLLLGPLSVARGEKSVDRGFQLVVFNAFNSSGQKMALPVIYFINVHRGCIHSINLREMDAKAPFSFALLLSN